ncbi:type VI secretion system contractile sheath protein TssC [Fibrella arboris]|uniref:type VI secretion system contractile sheath protein TssC n=1 Tax=Fibrella arboris TaxID=3242486 RepID=UPI0035225D4E
MEQVNQSAISAKERVRLANPAQQVADSVQQLERFGGFEFVETTVEGAQNLNPAKKARKTIFLTEKGSEKERKLLKKRLEAWSDLLANHDDIVKMVGEAEDKTALAANTLRLNLKAALDSTKELETAYRSVALFYKNADTEKIKNLSIVNADAEQVQDLDNTLFFDAIANELRKNYDKLDLRQNYSLLVLPGYLGAKKVVDKWARLAHETKAMLVTDYRHVDTPDDVMELFSEEDMPSADAYKANVMMTCNYLVGREAYTDLGEEEPLYLPPSTALAGKIYKTQLQQPVAGSKHGTLNEVDGVRFSLKKSEIASLEKMGLVPMVNEFNKVMAYSAKTLFTGDNQGLQTYSVVRVFDWIMKVLIDFLNRRAFENWTYDAEKDLKAQIVKFLNSITGSDKIIEDFKILRFERNRDVKDQVFLDIHIKPYFPAKSFLVRLDGTRGDDANDWKGGVEQE